MIPVGLTGRETGASLFKDWWVLISLNSEDGSQDSAQMRRPWR
jgi:hypothetical protein